MPGEDIQADVGKKGLQAYSACCAFELVLAVMIGLFIINLFNPTSAPGAETGASARAGATVPNTVTTLKNKKHTIEIAATSGKSAQEESPEALHAKGQKMTFDGECDSDEEKWYINMRWPYVKWAWDGRTAYVDSGKTVATKHAYAKVRVIVYNPRTKKTVVTAICESGPAPWAGSGRDKSDPPDFWKGYHRFDPPEATGRVAGLAPAAFDSIGASSKDKLEYGFAEDQNTPLGPVK